MGNYISQAKGEESCSAHVKKRAEAGLGCVALSSRAVVHESKSKNQRRRPDHEEAQKRKRAKVADKRLANSRGMNLSSETLPGNPRRQIKHSRQAEPSGNAPGQNDGFERVPKDDGDDEKADDSRKDQAACSRCASIVISAFKSRDTGQFAFALAAADSNALAEMPGTRAETSR